MQSKQDINDTKAEYKYKLDKIKDTKKDIKEAVNELAHKKTVLKYLNEQWETMPKDVNRNQYLKRINDIIGNIKRMKEDIAQVLGEVKDM